MADTFTWHIANLDRHVADGVVYTAHWTVSAERSVTGCEPITAGAYGSVGFGEPDPKKFIPYASLTEAKALEWTKEAIGGAEKIAEIESALSKQLDERETPTNEAGVPW